MENEPLLWELENWGNLVHPYIFGDEFFNFKQSSRDPDDILVYWAPTA